MDKVDECIKNCVQKLELNDHRGATNELYLVSKNCHTLLSKASDEEVEKFVKQMTKVLGLFNNKLEVIRNQDPTINNNSPEKDGARFLLMDTYRILRTSCSITKVQEMYGRLFGQKMMDDTRAIMTWAQDIYSGEPLTQSLAVAIQFLANMATGCQSNQDLVWDNFCPILQSWIDQTMQVETERDKEKWVKVVNLVCAMVDSCLPRQWQRNSNFMEQEVNHNLMLAIIVANSIWTSMDFGKKAMKNLVQVPGMFKKTMRSLGPETSLILLHFLDEVISDWRKCDESEGEAPTIMNNLCYLVEQVVVNQHLFNAEMLANPWPNHQEALRQLVRSIEVLSSATCCRSFAPALSSFQVRVLDTEPTTLLQHSLRLLQDISEKGRKEWNALSVARDETAVDQRHPAYLLRRDLVRIIGNLAYQNKANQDVIRTELGGVGIPLLFEHTNIDLRNPFIQEWAKLALTNVVRDNEENVKFVSSLKLQGTVDPSGILRDCGLVLETNGNKVIITQASSVPNLAKLAEKAPKRTMPL